MQKLNPPSRVQAAGLIVATLVFANLLAFAVLSYNLSAMVYPIGGDAIMIPIVNNLLNSLCILVLGTAGAMLPLHRIGWRLAAGRWHAAVDGRYLRFIHGDVLVVSPALRGGRGICAGGAGLHLGFAFTDDAKTSKATTASPC